MNMRIELTKKEWKAFMKAIENPPKPNKALRKILDKINQANNKE